MMPREHRALDPRWLFDLPPYLDYRAYLRRRHWNQNWYHNLEVTSIEGRPQNQNREAGNLRLRCHFGSLNNSIAGTVRTLT